ncbi:cbb3-type cytochrome c oxidase subunit 3 [uncultured Roseobacter sp.]|uniref:cbb3-type cytochrome c oxidase subunit 3 n=1 Tax=uncultured Roseobacter sp. TaxID=114847 RepID=UPI0026235482|nr:cbb3-type cytochrome c oxidase subunit 3 [uncultured Roseobacter sp.]
METYSLLREFADSWMLLVLFCVFVGIWFWVIRPGSGKAHREAATMIFRNDERPAPREEADK